MPDASANGTHGESTSKVTENYPWANESFMSVEVPAIDSRHLPWVASVVSVGHDQELTSADEQRAWNVLQLSENLGAGSGPAKKNEHVTPERGII